MLNYSRVRYLLPFAKPGNCFSEISINVITFVFPDVLAKIQCIKKCWNSILSNKPLFHLIIVWAKHWTALNLFQPSFIDQRLQSICIKSSIVVAMFICLCNFIGCLLFSSVRLIIYGRLSFLFHNRRRDLCLLFKPGQILFPVFNRWTSGDSSRGFSERTFILLVLN